MAARGHGTLARWAAVGLLVATLLALPSIVAALPAADADVPATELRAAVLASADVGHSGYAVAAGGLALPVTGRLTAVADLLSDRTSMRVWWRGPDRHRVDVVSAAGERGFHEDGAGSWMWSSEDARATRTGPGLLHLPAPPDLLPGSLGRRLLSEAADGELSRIGAERVAGRNALGLRLVPREAAAAVPAVDVWVDADSGLPLRVRVAGAGGDLAALDTRYLDVDLGTPDAAVIAFTPPPGALITRDQDQGVLEQAGQGLPRVPLPGELAGLPRRPVAGAPPAIGLYGRGVTLLAVVPVPPDLAGGLRRAVRQYPGSVADDLGARAAVGPLGLMVLDGADGEAYVLTGTVTLEALGAAAATLGGTAA